jgi:predicted SprT family Zn-dependent metalloprotease
MLAAIQGSFCLSSLFSEINQLHFDNFLEPIELTWNLRLRTSAGRFVPGNRRFFCLKPPRIEIARYLIEEEKAHSLVYDTLAHEMIHYWLWVLNKPYGHTPAFRKKMHEMGVSRYNPVPRIRPYKYLYVCVSCRKTFPARKKLGPLACASCCKAYSQGKYDARFKLAFVRSLRSDELAQFVYQSG